MIYFVQDSFSKAVKIGHGRNPEKRMSDLQVASPGLLTLLGTMDGGAREESLLHQQFEGFHLRGEWFKGDEDLIRMIRMLIFKQGRTSTVWDDCRRRGGCRTGLRGVSVGVIGWPDPYKIWASGWSATRTLLLCIYLADEEEPCYIWQDPTVEAEDRLTVSLADLVEGRYRFKCPPSFLQDIESERCILLSDWPVTCCEPDQRIEDF